jgi:outer membrane receptor protein involved in Fe transport
VAFNLPAQPADAALMSFCRQANVQLLFPFDELHRRMSSAVQGSLEPEEALRRLLAGTGYRERRNGKGRYMVVKVPDEGTITGSIRTPAGGPARGIHVVIQALRRSVDTDAEGNFTMRAVRAGTYRVVVAASGYQFIEIPAVRVEGGGNVDLETLTLKSAVDPAKLAPFVVQAESAWTGPLDGGEPIPQPRTAIGDLDQVRSETGALDYNVFTRDQIARSGVVNLNQFLQRQILDSDATTLPPEENENGVAGFASGSTNLNFGGFGDDATIVLVDGRRLPEIVTALPGNLTQGVQAPQPDVNVIPINMIERIEILPVSASALYSGSPVGGVINIVLRPAVNTTELTTTYTNSLGHFDAPQSTTSLLHGETLLGGKLRVRVNATFTQTSPPTEGQLGYIRAKLALGPTPQDQLFRATPNVSSSSGSPLFGPGTASFTSVAPGSDGSGGLAPFLSREGVQDLTLFTPLGGGLADSPTSIDYPFGRRSQSNSAFASATYDLFPWLQVGTDFSFGRTVNNTGTNVFAGSLLLPSSSPFNPFHQDVNVTLDETAPSIGADYNEAHVDYYSADAGLLFSLPNQWQASFDAQYGLNVTRYRGVEGVDTAQWQNLVNEGVYNPLRDTQAYAPPKQFVDQAVVFYGQRGDYVTVGDYDTFDSSLRITNASLALPTGTGGLTLGVDYRYARLGDYLDLLTYGDGGDDGLPGLWKGRSLQRVSGFGELQAPLLPSRWLPGWIKAVDTDVAARYTASVLANEANLAPTAALKVDFAGGFSLRSTYATSNRFPPPYFSSYQAASISTSGIGVVQPTQLYDPLLRQYEIVNVADAANPNLIPEAAVTQTYGLVYQHGDTHHVRLTLDYEDTVTSGQEVYLQPDQVIDLEGIFPMRVLRGPAQPGEPVGPIQTVLTGNFSLAWRHSENWNATFDYAWSDFLGGTLETYCRLIYFERYAVEALPINPPVDELSHPDGATTGILRERTNFGTGWSNHLYGFGIDGHFYHSRVLPETEWADQGSDRVKAYWQFDGYVQSDLSRLLPWHTGRYGLRGQVRVDNLFDVAPPRYADDPSGAGVQPYGDWRGRVYSASLTLTF